MEEVATAVLDAIARKTQRRAALTDQLSRLGIDSLAMAEIAFELEQALKIRIDEGVLDQPTVGDLVRHISALVDKRKPA